MTSSPQRPSAKRRGKHVPLRTCIGTREQHPKRDMVRLVQTPDGHVRVDPTGKQSGSRGAYISKSYAAAVNAVKNRRVQAEFETAVSQEDLDAILEYFKQFDTTPASAAQRPIAHSTHSAMTD